MFLPGKLRMNIAVCAKPVAVAAAVLELPVEPVPVLEPVVPGKFVLDVFCDMLSILLLD